MLFGPVLPIELVTSSRRARYFIVRVVYAVILLIVFWTQYESSMSWRVSGGGPITPSIMAQFATEFFETFAIVQVLAVLLVTPALVAGSIAEEKERRTLEYLFATDLRNWEIVIGKLAARLLHLTILLGVGWPILALIMLLGGVSMENVLAAFAVTASTAVTTGSLAIWSSVQARRARDAVMRVFVIGLALLLLPPLIDVFSWYPQPYDIALRTVVTEFLAADPFVCLNSAIAQSGTNWDPIVQLVRNQAVLAVPCCLLAWLNLRRAYLKETAGSTARRGRRAIRLWRPKLGTMPVVWKEMFAERSALSLGLVGLIAQTLLMLAAVVPCVWIFASSYQRARHLVYLDELQWYVVFVGTILSCIGLIAVAVRSAGSVTTERERQTWDVLLSTPIEPWQIIHGKLAGALYAARGMVFVQLILWILGVAGRSIWLPALPILLGELVLFGLFVALVGLLYSMRLRTTLRAMAATIGTTVFIGGGYLLCCTPVLWSGPRETEILISGCIPFLLGMPPALHPSEWHLTSEIVGPYLLGLGFYCVVTVCLYGAVRASFDDLCGRVSASYRVSKLPRDLRARRTGI